MVSTCCVINCRNRYRKGEKLRLFRFPFSKSQRLEIWIKNLNRRTKTGEIWRPRHYDRVCSDHFIEGKPVDDPLHPDYAPNINMGYERKIATMNRWKARQKREDVLKDKYDREVAAGALQVLSSVKKSASDDNEESSSTKDDESKEELGGDTPSADPMFSNNSACALIKKLVHKHQGGSDTETDSENPNPMFTETAKTAVTPDSRNSAKTPIPESTASAKVASTELSKDIQAEPVVYPVDPAKFAPSPFQDHKGPPDPVNSIEKLRQNPPSEAPKWVGPSPFNKKRGRPRKPKSPPPEKKTTLLPKKYTPSGIVDFSALQRMATSSQPTPKSLQGFSTHDVKIRMLEMKVKSLENEADLFKTMRDYYKEQVTQLQLLTKQLEVKIDDKKFSYRKVKEHCQLYTGLTEEMFEFFLSEMDSEVFKKFCGISSQDMLLLTMMRLRLNLPVKELALRFDITKGSVHRYLEAMFPALRNALEKHVTWVDRGDCLSNLPSAFKMSKYPRVNSVIGCLEVSLRMTKILDSYRDRSKFKNQDSVKFLIAATPTGEVTFTSNGKGGKLTDLAVTIESGYFSQLKSMDEILTDSSIPIHDHCSLIGVSAHCPAITRGDLGEEVICPDPQTEEMRKLHKKSWGATIERMQNFSILSSRCPFSLVKYLDDIVVITAAIINLQKRREDKKPLGRHKRKRDEDDCESMQMDDQIEKSTEGESDKETFDQNSDMETIEDCFKKETEESNTFTVVLQSDGSSSDAHSNNHVEETLVITKNERDGTLTIKNEKDGTVTVVTVNGENETLMSEVQLKSETALTNTSAQQMVLAVSDMDSRTDLEGQIVLQEPLSPRPVIVQAGNAEDAIYLLEQV